MVSRLDSLVKSIVFPRPRPATFDTSTHPDSLLLVPCVDRDTLAENGHFTNAYLFRHPSSTHLLIYAHPNAVDIGMLYEELRHLSKHAQVDVLAFEYSGYGLTHCDITETSIHDDTRSAYWFARHYLAVPPERVILCGRSIGAAPAAKLCASLPPAETPSLLILQCPFTALSECIQAFSHNAVSLANFLGYNWFRTVDLIADVHCPVVLHHGSHDTVVPISHSYALRKRRNAAARPCVTYFYQEDGKGHNNLSHSLLIRIIQDKVDKEGLTPLNTPWPSNLVVRPPLHPHLFPPEYRKQPLRLLHQQWQQHYSLEPFLTSRDSLYILLTASVCSFAMKVASAWQVYSDVVKRNARNVTPTPSASPPRGSAGRASTSASGHASRQSSFTNATSINNNSSVASSSTATTHRRTSPLAQHRGRQQRDARHGKGSAGGDRRCTKDAFIARCIACWGSPLGVHIPVAGQSHSADALVFGSYVPPGKCDTFDVGWHFSTRPPCPMVTIAELPMTPALLRAVKTVVSSAPELVGHRSDSDDGRRRRQQQMQQQARGAANLSDGLKTPLNLSTTSSNTRHTDDDGDSSSSGGHRSEDSLGGKAAAAPSSSSSPTQPVLPAFINPDLVSAIQTECERITGFMSEDGAHDLQTLFEDFEAGCQERLSPKCRAIAGSSFEEESFDEVTEWLRPYVERPQDMEAFAAEVPWDYYLFKARVLADRQRLGSDMDWPLCLRAVEETGIVASVYQLFQRYHLPRPKVPHDA